MLKYLAQSLQADTSGRFKDKTPAEKASLLVNSGKPTLDKDAHDSDDDDDIPRPRNDLDDDVFGIRPTSDLKPNKVEEDNILGDFDMSDPTEEFLQKEEKKDKKPAEPVSLDFLKGVMDQAADL